MLSVPIRVSRRLLFLGSLQCGMAAIAFSDTGSKVSTIPEVITDDYSTLWVLLGLVLASMATWVYGRWGALGMSSQTRRKAWFVSFFLLASGVWLGYPTEKEDLNTLQWEKWTPDRERELLEAGKAVYVDYTAKWCWSCQVNKRVFYYEDVIRKIRELDIVLLKADWTDKNPVILNALQSYGRGGVPLNIYHKAHDSETLHPPPILMPEALTEGMVLDVLETGKPYSEPGEQGFLGDTWICLSRRSNPKFDAVRISRAWPENHGVCQTGGRRQEEDCSSRFHLYGRDLDFLLAFSRCSSVVAKYDEAGIGLGLSIAGTRFRLCVGACAFDLRLESERCFRDRAISHWDRIQVCWAIGLCGFLLFGRTCGGGCYALYGAVPWCRRGCCLGDGVVASHCRFYLCRIGIGLSLPALIVDAELDKSFTQAGSLDGIL